jgi:hypothetical protein
MGLDTEKCPQTKTHLGQNPGVGSTSSLAKPFTGVPSWMEDPPTDGASSTSEGETRGGESGAAIDLNQVYSMGRAGLYLARSHPRASEVRRKLKAVNRLLLELASDPVVLSALRTPKVAQRPTLERLFPSVKGRDLGEPHLFERSALFGPTANWPAHDEAPGSKKSGRKARRSKSGTRDAEDTPPSVKSGLDPTPEKERMVVPVLREPANAVPASSKTTRDMEGKVPPTSRSRVKPTSPDPKANCQGGSLVPEGLASTATDLKFRSCQAEYSALRRAFPGVGLYHTPYTAAERKLKKAYLGLLAKHSCDGASFLPMYYRTHPRSLPEARRRAKERRERRSLEEGAKLLLLGATTNAGIRRLARSSRPGGNPAHKRTELINV